MKRRIAVVTTSRADYSHLFWVLREIEAHPELDLELIVTGAHLSGEFGAAVREVERDGLRVAARVECLLSSDTDVGMAKTIGVAVLGLTEALDRLRPDLLLLIADRYELLAPAAVALALRIPIAHIEGGEISEGAIDDAVRNALTKMSHVHFTPTRAAYERVIAMGEEPWRVHQAGAPSLDHLRRTPLLTREQLSARLGEALAEHAVVVAYHPVTLARDTLEEADALFGALELLQHPFWFCFPNADAGSRRLIGRARRFCDGRSDARLFVNLHPLEYWSLLANAELMLGNSSSGIMETASLALPTVNVGRRQQGRERPVNVIDSAPETAAILQAIERATAAEFRRSLHSLRNPYGDGDAASRIVAVLESLPAAEELLHKRAVRGRSGDG